MKFSWRMIAAAFSYALGVLGWCYVGGYKILTGPVRGLILAQMAGSMSFGTTGGGPDRGIYISFAGRRSLVHWVYVK
ncbi:MAG: phospho-N-acetylmuramoyl-pentapeptide-transferase [Roseburia intestinalis]